MSEALRLADALDDTPNWQKESFGSDWKSGTMKFDSTPFEAAAELRRLHAENETLRADAERYRFVRRGGAYIEPHEHETYMATDSGGKYYKDLRDMDLDIDAAIDAALANVEASNG